MNENEAIAELDEISKRLAKLFDDLPKGIYEKNAQWLQITDNIAEASALLKLAQKAADGQTY